MSNYGAIGWGRLESRQIWTAMDRVRASISVIFWIGKKEPSGGGVDESRRLGGREVYRVLVKVEALRGPYRQIIDRTAPPLKCGACYSCNRISTRGTASLP